MAETVKVTEFQEFKVGNIVRFKHQPWDECAVKSFLKLLENRELGIGLYQIIEILKETRLEAGKFNDYYAFKLIHVRSGIAFPLLGYPLLPSYFEKVLDHLELIAS